MTDALIRAVYSREAEAGPSASLYGIVICRSVAGHTAGLRTHYTATAAGRLHWRAIPLVRRRLKVVDFDERPRPFLTLER